MAKKFLFVCGCPRSGTSHLQLLLSQHPVIAIGLERFNLRTFARRTMPADFTPERFFRMEPGDTWYDDLSRFAWHYSHLTRKYDAAEYVGDKTPRAYEVFDHLIRHFPDVRFLVLVRNVFDVAASYESRRRSATEWNPAWNARKAVEHWNDSLRCTRAAADLAPVLPVVYEDLVSAEESLAAVADFLEVDPAPLREARRRFARGTPPPEPGVGAACLDPEDAACIESAADHEALGCVLRLARRPVAYRGAGRTVRQRPEVVSKYSAADSRGFIDPRSRPHGARVDLRNPPETCEPTGPYVACVGSAATFGRLVERPFCTLLAERLGMPVLNLGIGGARPEIFVEDEGLAGLIRGAACVVVEAMSARGHATELFVPLHGSTNMGKVPDAATAVPAAPPFVDDGHLGPLRDRDTVRLEAARMICRAAYVRGMKRLAELAEHRGVLLYFSRRAPEFTPPAQPGTFAEWSGGFPHHVDRRMLDLLAPLFRTVVTAVSSPGSPETVLDGETGRPLPLVPGTAHPERNSYSPWSVMHRLAADALEPALRGMLEPCARAAGAAPTQPVGPAARPTPVARATGSGCAVRRELPE